MPRAAPNKRKLSAILLQRLRRKPRPYMIWDTHQRGLALRVEPTGYKSFKLVYRHHGRPRWFHLAPVNALALADARKLAAKIMLQVIEGKDPAAEKRAARGAGTFAELADRYVAHYAKRHNKSWEQPAALVRRCLLPRWGKLTASTITRADVKAIMTSMSATPVLANQTLAAASAIFSWAVKEELVTTNPCRGVERNETRSRERVLSDSEIPRFWSAFDDAEFLAGEALKVLLLTGQRPGEVAHMRREHIKDGWWTMPGKPEPNGWPGTKNGATHRVWLPAAAQAIIAELSDDEPTGLIFAGGRQAMDAAMRIICRTLKVERATPHDLRRTHGSTITALGFGREAMNRIQNHREGGIADVYDRFEYAEQNKRVMETVAAHILALAEGKAKRSNVVRLKNKV
jgi:integrase